MNEAIEGNGDSGNNPRCQRRISDTRDARLERKHAYYISDYIDGICKGGYVHRHIRSADAAAHGRARIIDRERRERARGYAHILDARRHNIVIHPAEKQIEERAGKNQYERGHTDGADGRKHQQLTCRFARLHVIPAADILADYDCAAGRKGGKEENYNGVKGIDERHARNCGVADKADDKRIRYTDEQQQKLLDKKRNYHRPQIFVCE